MFMLSNYLCLSALEVIDTLYPFLFNAIFVCGFVKWCALYFILKLFFMHELAAFVVWRVLLILVFMVLSIGFPCNVVQFLCSLSEWLHLNCSSIGTGFNGTENNGRIARNLGILMMNSSCFAIYFQQHYSYVCSDI